MTKNQSPNRLRIEPSTQFSKGSGEFTLEQRKCFVIKEFSGFCYIDVADVIVT